VRKLLTIAVAPLVLLLSGCSGIPRITSHESVANSVRGVPLQGIVHGGQQPIVGAHIYLLAANTDGYGSSSQSLLTSGSGRTEDSSGNFYVTSGTGGAFNISEEYTCPGSNTQVYLYSIGGNPGAGGTNGAAGLIAGLGSCGSLSSTEGITINEVSTVATAYAIAGFATDATHVSSSGTSQAQLGIQNAFGAIANLESLSTGATLSATPAGNGAPPNQEINTLADMLAACINSSGAITGPTNPTPCYTLFTNAANGSTTPSETATAAINIAHNPGLNITNLYALATASSPFQPTLSSPPNDFTVGITFSGAGLDGSGFAPEGIAVDASGNVWVPNFNSNTVSEFKYNGVVLSNPASLCDNYFCGAGLDEPTSVAIDIYGNAWVANFNGTSITEFNANGYGISGPPGYEGSGLYQPYGVAVDNASHTWVANFGGNNLSEFTSSGSPLSGQNGYAVGSLVGPAGIAADTAGDVWAVDYNASNYLLVESSPSGTQNSDPGGYSGGGLNAPYGVAIDGAGNVWVTNQVGGAAEQGSVSEFGPSGCTAPATFCAESPSTGFSGGGVDGPYGIAIDGLGNVWTANRFGWSISEFNSSGIAITPENGYYTADLESPYGIAIDPSGNVWVANGNDSPLLTEFVGAAAPVVTPLAAGAEYQQLGTRP